MLAAPLEGAVPKPLAELVRDKVDGGALPLEAPVKLWAGRGAGRVLRGATRLGGDQLRLACWASGACR